MKPPEPINPVISCRRRFVSFLTVLAILLLAIAPEQHEAFAQFQDRKTVPIPDAPKGDVQVVSFDVEHDFNSSGPLTLLRVFMAIPKTVEKRQNVIKINLSPSPLAIYDDNQTRYAVFHLNNPPQNITIKMTGEIEVHRADLMSALAALNPSNPTAVPTLSAAEKKEFLKSEKSIEVNDPTIIRIANKIQSPQQRLSQMPQPHSTQDVQTAEIETIQDVLQWIRQNVKYDAEDTPEGAVGAARQGKAVCQQFSELFIALCRAKGIPAKYVSGLYTYFDKRNPNSTPRHAWAETFISGLGWVPFDPTWMPSTSDVVTPSYIGLTRIRNHEELKISGNPHFFFNYKSPAKLSVYNSYSFKALSP